MGKTNTADAQKSAASIADALTTTAGYENAAWDPLKDDAIQAKEISDITGGVTDVDTSDVFFEEESGLVAKEDEEVAEERSLWAMVKRIQLMLMTHSLFLRGQICSF